MALRLDRSPYEIPYQTTDPIEFVLRDVDAATTAAAGDVIDLTGLTVTIEAHDRNGNAVTLAGTVSVPTGTDGVARYTPSADTDFDNHATESPYFVRWKVSDGATHFFVPTDERDEWRIIP